MSTPYKLAARLYAELGWSPVPLPAKEKSPPPDTQPHDPKTPVKHRPEVGAHPYTGQAANPVTEEDLRLWLAPRGRATAGNFVFPPSNICLRLPEGFGVRDENGEPERSSSPDGLWDILGIDVDDYEGKDGAATLARAEDRWGKLPPTWVTTSRPVGGLSGIRLFRVPSGLTWPGNLAGVMGGAGDGLGGGVDLVRAGHRYVIVGPSLHDKKPNREYYWQTPEGEHLVLSRVLQPGVEAEFDLPAPGEIVRLPQEWVDGLSIGDGSGGGVGGRAARRARVSKSLTEDEVKEWLAERDGMLGMTMCSEMERTLVKYQRKVREAGEDGGAHDAARDGAWALIGDAAAGHAGVTVALSKLKASFLAAVEERARAGGARGERIVTAEWKGIVVRGVTKIASEGEPEEEDACAVLMGGNDRSPRQGGAAGGGRRHLQVVRNEPEDDYSEAGEGDDAAEAEDGSEADASAEGGKPARRRKRKAGEGRLPGAGDRGSSAFEYEWNDTGNALRLRRQVSGELIWCMGLGGWHYWDRKQGRWVLDPEGLYAQNQVNVMRKDMRLDSEFIENEKVRESFGKFITKCGNASVLVSVIRALKTMPDITVPASEFDQNPRQLLCSNGIVYLGTAAEGGVGFRTAEPSDRITLTTGVPYKDDAKADAWDNFLKRVLPDEDTRRWAQKAVGYSLLGRNPERLFFICKGPTSSGKSTFLEAISSALGQYGGSFNLSLFKAEKQQGPNVQLVRALPRRFLVTSEASEHRRLDADEIKRVLGNEKLSGRLNNSNEMVERVPAFTPWMSTNPPPHIPNADMALWKRLMVIPFTNQVAEGEEDATLAERFLTAECKEAILAWAVEGWQMYAEEGLFGPSGGPSPEIMLETMEVRGGLSDFDLWLEEQCETDPRGANSEWSVASNVLYQDYREWCEENGVDHVSNIAFGIRMKDRKFASARVRGGPRGADLKVRCWKGLRLKTSES